MILWVNHVAILQGHDSIVVLWNISPQVILTNRVVRSSILQVRFVFFMRTLLRRTVIRRGIAF